MKGALAASAIGLGTFCAIAGYGAQVLHNQPQPVSPLSQVTVQVPEPTPSGYTSCDPVNAPELCTSEPDNQPLGYPSSTSRPTAHRVVVPRHTAARHTAAPQPMATIVTVNTPTKITEDDPRWDCHTMGNHRCGKHS